MIFQLLNERRKFKVLNKISNIFFLKFAFLFASPQLSNAFIRFSDEMWQTCSTHDANFHNKFWTRIFGGRVVALFAASFILE